MKFKHCGACGKEMYCYKKQQCALDGYENPFWMNLRAKFFSECVEHDGSGNRKIAYAPHDLFEWFKKHVTSENDI